MKSYMEGFDWGQEAVDSPLGTESCKPWVNRYITHKPSASQDYKINSHTLSLSLSGKEN